MMVADLFSGLGGFTEGATQAGLPVAIAANHWAEAVAWHTRNHPEVRHLQQDLQQMDMRLLEGVELVIASPECQGHSPNGRPSVAGVFRSEEEREKAIRRRVLQRSTAWAVLSAAEVARPRTIIVENVPWIYEWELFAAWRGGLEALGYHVRQHVIHADRYGSAQARSRAIITCDLRRPVELADSWGSSSKCLADCLDLHETPEHRWTVIAEKSERMRSRMLRAQGQAGPRCLWNNVSEANGRPLTGYSPTLTTKCGSQLYLLDGPRCRILNPRELARIQGFPEHYQIPEARGLAGHLIGNAIDVHVARGVLEQAA